MSNRYPRSLGRWLGAALLLCGGWLVGCTPREETLGASINGYNHTHDQSIYFFTVNGNMGSGMGPQSGGGKFSCCVAIPKVWRPGIKVKVWWDYQGGTRIPPEPPPHMAEVELPRYKTQDIGSVQVHFYPDQKIKLLVSGKSIGHVDYPPELEWDKPTPADAIAGTALPFPPEENIEIPLPLQGETDAQANKRWSAGESRAKARREAKQARWDALVARKAAGLSLDPSTLPKLLPREPMWEPERVEVPAARSTEPLPSSTAEGAR